MIGQEYVTWTQELDVQRKYVYAKLVVYQHSSVSISGGGATGSDLNGSDHDRVFFFLL
jgi:hypothetical protein